MSNQKQRYFLLAVLVGALGVAIIGGIIFYLPGLTGQNTNPIEIVDSLEKEGWRDFSSNDIESVKFEMNQVSGKVVILSFWASWCAPCLEEFPSMLKLAHEFPSELEFVAVSADEKEEDIRSFLKGFPSYQGANIHIIWDKDSLISKKYLVQKMPENFIFNRQGKLSRKVVGSIDWGSEESFEFFKHLTSK